MGFHIALVEQLFQHPIEALFGDAQNFQQFGDGKAGMAQDEVKHSMMRATKAQALQQPVGVGHEIAIGEEEQLDQLVSGRI